MALTRYYEEIRRYIIMENMIKMIVTHTNNLLGFAGGQEIFNSCTIKILDKHTKQIASLQGTTMTNTFLIGCIIGHLIITRKK